MAGLHPGDEHKYIQTLRAQWALGLKAKPAVIGQVFTGVVWQPLVPCPSIPMLE